MLCADTDHGMALRTIVGTGAIAASLLRRIFQRCWSPKSHCTEWTAARRRLRQIAPFPDRGFGRLLYEAQILLLHVET